MLDKHSESVVQLVFSDDRYLVSGGQEGTVHVHCLVSGITLMKRTNLFRHSTPYSILSLGVGGLGLAFALDTLGNARLYDVYH